MPPSSFAMVVQSAFVSMGLGNLPSTLQYVIFVLVSGMFVRRMYVTGL